jgi:long-chain acyl-CoA synthetase
MKKTISPWAFMDEFRGKLFNGTWPTLPELFRITVARHGQRQCFTVFEPDRVSLNYTEALALIQAVARWLYSKGIRKGDKIALTSKNSPEWAVAYLGIVFAGAVVVPIDYQLKNEETELLMRTARAKILFVDEEKYAHFKENPKGLTDIVSLRRGVGQYIYDLNGPEAPIEEAAENDLAAILFTSGTTGDPKGVMLTHQNLVSDCFLAQAIPFDVYHTDVFYAILPIHHIYAMLAVFIETIGTGAEVVFGKKLVTALMLKELKEGKVTMLLGVPMLFNKLLDGILRGIRAKGPIVYGIISFLMAISGLIKKTFKVNPGKKIFHSILEKASLSTVRVCIAGGGPLASSVFRKFNQMGIDFVQGYGLTETSPIINLNPIEHYKEESVGKIVPQADMKILNPGERGIGEVIVKGPMVTQGYFEKPELTAESFTPDGYFKTGDLGYLDSEGYLYLTGRAKNVIVTEGGKKVFPEEIENQFQLYGQIDQILIRGYIMDQKMKREGIEALIYPTPDLKNEGGQPYTAEELKAMMEKIIADVNQHLLFYQKINRVVILDKPMEMSSTKKIKRFTV